MPSLLQELRQVPSPPRPVMRTAQLRIDAGLRFAGWILAVVGIFIIGVPIFTQLSDRPGYLFPDLYLDRNHHTAQGIVESIAVKVGKGSKYQKITFHFSPENRSSQAGHAYALRPDLREQETVTIEYDPSDPSLARISKTNAAVFPFLMLIGFSVFLLIGLILLIIGYRLGKRWDEILRSGDVAAAVIKDIRRDKTRGTPKHPIYAVTYEFTDCYRGQRIEGKSMIAAERGAQSRISYQEGDSCLAAYDRNRPERNILLTDAHFKADRAQRR